MNDRIRRQPGIRAYRKTALALAGSTLLLGGAAQAQDEAAPEAEAPDPAIYGQGGDDEAAGEPIPSIIVNAGSRLDAIVKGRS